MRETEGLLAAMRGEVDAAAFCQAAGITAAELTAAVREDLQRRLPPADQHLRGGVRGRVEIVRDRFGVPHIFADDTADLYFGLGLAVGQDRLWQIDLFRRRGQGRLAEVLGEGQVESDLAHRTLRSAMLARADLELCDEATRRVLDAFVGGVNQTVTSRSASG